jgi:hypothetical protein
MMHLFSFLLPSTLSHPPSLVVSPHLENQPLVETNPLPPPPEDIFNKPHTHKDIPPPIKHHTQLTPSNDFEETTVVSHAPGWTIFRNLYMANGTIYIVSSHPPSYFPDIRLMTSTGLPAENTPENIQLREPTSDNMAFILPQEANHKWGRIEPADPNRIWTVAGNTFLINDPPQFLRHYYHFVAELLLGAWAFWVGAFSQSADGIVGSNSPTPSLDTVPAIDRFIFANSNADGWRDNPSFNRYFLRAAFPSLTVEHEEDWLDRILTSTPPPYPNYNYANPDPNPEQTRLDIRKGSRVWHFPLVMFADRSAAFRGEACGSRTQRTAAEAFEAMEKKLPANWWDNLRKAVIKFAGANDNIKPTTSTHTEMSPENSQAHLPMPEKVVITYVNRQKTQRRLVHADHDSLVKSLQELAQRRGWEFIDVHAENLSKDEQIRIMARTTILLGVHGNGLTHLVMMPNTKISTVIEMFVPGGFAHDYQWTTHALGMRHFAVWNDTWHTLPNKPRVDYPEGFQGPDIPAYGPKVAELIEGRVDGRYP